ncbi:MAG TPA: ribonuclease HII [Clostridiales bacterium]|nr:MAG: ribonuclease HII [Clostridiales bacterium GWD2_32_59]HAN10372.1 ribonuclease HII [Clostridiales bacterium]
MDLFAQIEALKDELKDTNLKKAKVEKLEKKLIKLNAELARLENMNVYENRYYRKGCKIIAGIDEVGRGPLAGPVVSACVILPQNCMIEGINDSKKLSSKRRTEIYDIIRSKALYIGICLVKHDIVDKYNILKASLFSMKKAIEKIEDDVKIDVVLVDGNHKIPELIYEQETIISGDAKSISIAAASIIAKVTRDRLMEEKYHDMYPEYNFKSNKGYGTSEHVAALRKCGPCEIHRRSFIKNFVN